MLMLVAKTECRLRAVRFELGRIQSTTDTPNGLKLKTPIRYIAGEMADATEHALDRILPDNPSFPATIDKVVACYDGSLSTRQGY
jgi:hypothetical protein